MSNTVRLLSVKFQIELNFKMTTCLSVMINSFQVQPFSSRESKKQQQQKLLENMNIFLESITFNKRVSKQSNYSYRCLAIFLMREKNMKRDVAD